MKNVEWVVAGVVPPSGDGLREFLVRFLLPLGMLAVMAGTGYRVFVIAEESRAPSALAASFIEVQATYLQYSLEGGQPAEDFCKRIEDSLLRTKDLASRTRTESVLRARTALLRGRLESLGARCRAPDAGMVGDLAEARTLAREIGASLGDVGRHAVAYPNPAPHSPASRDI